ncbi:flagellar hook-length control protein FliK [Sphingomonas sp.]|uniref:flagellar hook-length control protein FliK n=1 Tax=Sphingomonas sp. TaxID=28214 RepID=UPI0035C7FAAA
MTAISSLLSSTAALPPPVSAGAATPTLASFLDLLAPVMLDLVPGERQSDAGSGKSLPLQDDALGSDADALAWLGVTASPVVAMVAPTEGPAPGADGSGVPALRLVVPTVGTASVGTMRPSPVAPLMAPLAAPLPGSDGVASMASGTRILPASAANAVEDLPSMVGFMVSRAPLASPIGTSAGGVHALTPSLPASDGVASVVSGTRTSPAAHSAELRASLTSPVAFAVQHAPVSVTLGASDDVAVPEQRFSRYAIPAPGAPTSMFVNGDRAGATFGVTGATSWTATQPFSREPLAAPIGTSAAQRDAITTRLPGSDEDASLASGTRASPALASGGVDVSLPSASEFAVPHAPASVGRGVPDNAASSEQIVGLADLPTSGAPAAMFAQDERAGAPLGNTGPAVRTGAQPFLPEPLATPIVASAIGVEAAATPVPARWVRSNGGSVSLVAGAPAPSIASVAPTSRAPIGQQRFTQMIGEPARVRIDLPNMSLAVPLPAVAEPAVAASLPAIPTSEAITFASAQMSVTGSRAPFAGAAIVSDAGAGALSGAPVSVGARSTASAPIVLPGGGAAPGVPLAGVGTTGTPVGAPVPGAAAPAARVFAEAIHHALGEQVSRQPSDLVATLAPIAPALHGVPTTGTAQGAPLDLRHEHWPAAMIERIVSLRDMAAENDTRLRLSPDMLGTIDVSLRRDGDQVQVQISAEQAQTRQLLAEAQPRLAELADARGVKLHLTGGHAGGQAGGGDRPGGDAPRHHPSTPVSTSRQTASHDDAGSTDQRIA